MLYKIYKTKNKILAMYVNKQNWFYNLKKRRLEHNETFIEK